MSLNDNDDIHRRPSQDEDNNRQQSSAPARRNRGRPRGGVGVDLPNEEDVQMNSPSESQPGGSVFRYVFYVEFYAQR